MEQPNPTNKQKPTKTELRRRLALVESLIVECASVPDLLRYFAEKENLTLSRRTIEGYVHIAEQRIERAAEPTRKLEIEKAKRRFERCFARSIGGSKKNIPAAIAAQKAINRMLGLDPPKESEGELNLEEFARQVVLQRKEMERLSLGPVGLQREIFELFERYRLTGENCVPVIEELAKQYRKD